MNIPRVTEKYNANHFVIESGGVRFLQSYDSIIAWDRGDRVELSEHWDYSRTTMRYLGQFLGEDAKAIRAKVESGEYPITMDPQGRKLSKFYEFEVYTKNKETGETGHDIAFPLIEAKTEQEARTKLKKFPFFDCIIAFNTYYRSLDDVHIEKAKLHQQAIELLND